MHVVVVGDFPPDVRERIRAAFPCRWEIHIVTKNEVWDFLQKADVIIPEHFTVDDHVLDQAPGLVMIQTGSGFDNVDVAACTKRGIRVCNAAGVNAAAVAEHVMALMLGWYKNLPYLDRFMKEHRDQGELCYSGSELFGKTIGIIGLGRIGQRVAGYCRAFGMRIMAAEHGNPAPPYVERVEVDQLYAQSSVITVHVPLNASTYHMIDGEAFGKMRNDALFINTARGAVVKEADLIQALEEGKIAGACLDVYEQEPLAVHSPLRDLPNVILTPHTAGLPDGVRFHAGRYHFFADNIGRVENGMIPENALNDVPILRIPRGAGIPGV